VRGSGRVLARRRLSGIDGVFYGADWAAGRHTWAATDIMFKGISHSINLQNVLCDAISSAGVTYSGDTYYGGTNRSIQHYCDES
jgi:hypothetical protein